MKLMPAFLLYAAFACLHAPVHSLEIKHKQLSGNQDRANLADVAEIAKKVYNLERYAGWTRERAHNFDGSMFLGVARTKDHCAIYRKYTTCAFAISGSNDIRDWVQNAEALAVRSWRNTGTGVHGGFLRESNDIINHRHYNDYKNYLRGGNCAGGVILTGHSLGGAVANLLAAFANNQNQFFTKYLYTFGAPSVSQQPLNNNLKQGGCFDGGRFYNKDHIYVGHTSDPVPAAATVVGYRHPKLKAYRFDDPPFEDLKVHEAHCLSTSAIEDPKFAIQGDLGDLAFWLHFQSKYIERVRGHSVRDAMTRAAPVIAGAPAPPPPPPPPSLVVITALVCIPVLVLGVLYCFRLPIPFCSSYFYPDGRDAETLFNVPPPPPRQVPSTPTPKAVGHV